jgi:hypothetical protein
LILKDLFVRFCPTLTMRSKTIDALFQVLIEPHNPPPSSYPPHLPPPSRPNLFSYLRSRIALALKLRSGSIDCHSGSQLINCRCLHHCFNFTTR